MKRLLFALLLFAGLGGLFAQTNVLTGTVVNYGISPQTNVAVALTLVSPNPRIVDGEFVRRDPIVTYSSTNDGSFSFTNIIWGKYTLSLAGRTPTEFTLYVQTNTTGVVPLGSLATTVTPLPPNPATNYYTMPQVDALLAGVTGGSSSLTNAFRVLNVKELGAAGDGSTDDTAAIQNAINLSTNSALPSSIYFPPGHYKVTSSLRIWPNDTTQNLGARTGPTRLLGDGSGASIIESYVTNGAAIDARIDALDGPGLVGFTMERLGIFGPIGRGAWTNDASEGLAIGRSNAVHWTGTNWITEGYGSQYYGNQIRVQDCDFSGFTKAIGSTNVWGFVVDGGTFHSNRLHALAFNCTHSASLRNVSVYGIPLAGRLTDIAIGFFAPREAPSWWGFGDTAKLEQTQVQWARVAVYNDELALQDSGGNYQFVDLAHQIRSGSRTNGSSVEIWRPYADIFGATYCDSYFTWVTNSPAMVEIDSYVAPRVTFYQLIGDVCKNVRPKVNIIGATATGSGNNGTLTFGTTNLDYPQLIGGVSPWPALFNGSNVISLTKLTNSAPGIQNGASGVTLDTPAFYPSMRIESDSLGSQGVTLGTVDTGTGSRFTISDSYTSGTEYLRVDDAGISSAVPFIGNGSGLTNFSRSALAASGAVTNGQSSFTAGTVVASGAGFIGDASSFTNVPSLANGTKSFYFSNPGTWTTPESLAGSNVTASGTFTGNGSGLTNVNVSTATGLLPMGTLSTNTPVTTNGYLTTDGVSRFYSLNAAGLTNFGTVAPTNLSVLMTPGSSIKFGTNLSVPAVHINSSNQVGIGKLVNSVYALDVAGAVIASSQIHGNALSSSSTLKIPWLDSAAGPALARLGTTPGFVIRSQDGGYYLSNSLSIPGSVWVTNTASAFNFVATGIGHFTKSNSLPTAATVYNTIGGAGFVLVSYTNAVLAIKVDGATNATYTVTGW